MNLSVRNRIALWYAITVPALIFAVAFTAQNISITSLKTALDELLQERASTAAFAVIASPVVNRGVLDDIMQGSPTNFGLYVSVYYAKGGTEWSRGAVPEPLRLKVRALLRSQPASGQFVTFKQKETDALRTYVVPVTDPQTGEVKAFVETAESLLSVSRAQARLLWYTLVEGLVGSAISLAIGLVIFRSGFRPLDRILAHLRAVSGQNLKSSLKEDGLPPELRELAESLNTMWQRLDAAFAEREHLVATVSHEMRTPLTALLGQTEVALLSPKVGDTERLALEKMRDEIKRLVRLTNNLLRNVELEGHPHVQLDLVSLKEVAEEVVGDLWVLAGNRAVSLGKGPEEWVLGNRDLLKELLVNLLDNAIKYTPETGTIDLDWRGEGDFVVLRVADTGSGIPPELLPRIEEPFLKGPVPADAMRRGSGLGLSIVRHIVAIHRGEITFESQPGRGTVVTVRVPRLQPEVPVHRAASSGQTPVQSAVSGPNKTISRTFGATFNLLPLA